MKILIFTGLEHHVSRMQSVIDAFESSGHEILLISSQNPYGDHLSDFEIPLKRTGRPYRLLSHYRLDPRLKPQISKIQRRVFAAMRERFKAGSAPPWFAMGSGHDLSVAEVIEDEATMEVVLDTERPDAIVVLHEANFWTRTLASVAARTGYPLYSFQEGLFYHIMANNALKLFAEFSRTMFSWGQRDMARMVGAGADPKRLVEIGPTHLCPALNDQSSRAEIKVSLGLPANNKLLLLIVPNGMVTQLPKQFLDSLAQFVVSNPNLHFACKWRAVESGAHKPPIEALFRQALGDRYHSFAAEDPYTVVRAADCVLTQATTLGCEAVGLGCPVLEIAWEGSDAQSILDLNDLAGIERVHGISDFPLIARYLDEGIPADIAMATQSFKDKCLGGMRGDSARMVVDHIANDVPIYREEFGPAVAMM